MQRPKPMQPAEATEPPVRLVVIATPPELREQWESWVRLRNALVIVALIVAAGLLLDYLA